MVLSSGRPDTSRPPDSPDLRTPGIPDQQKFIRPLPGCSMTENALWINTVPVRSPEPVLTGFDLRLALRFSQKSVSEDTRRAYHRVVREFFSFSGNIHPTRVSPELVVKFRDQQLAKRKRAATVAFKLAVVRSFFEYLRAAGMVNLNPASTRLVPVPQVDQGGA